MHMTKEKRYHLYKLAGIGFAAFLSALGAVPYGFKFGYMLEPYNHSLGLLLGIVLAAAVCIANTGLGAYSLLRMQSKQKIINPIFLRILSFISAIPLACMCFFAYVDITPFVVTAFLTAATFIINASIGYTAIFNFLLELKKWRSLIKSHAGIACRVIGFFIGLAVSLTAYMAAIEGFTRLLASLRHLHLSENTIYQISCTLGLITWVPFAFLFANAAQIAAYNTYNFLANFNEHIRHIDAEGIAILILAICSGASYAQMTIVFFDPGMPIPPFLKQPSMHNFIYSYLVPFSFISSAAVNYLALKNINGAATLKQVPVYT